MKVKQIAKKGLFFLGLSAVAVQGASISGTTFTYNPNQVDHDSSANLESVTINGIVVNDFMLPSEYELLNVSNRTNPTIINNAITEQMSALTDAEWDDKATEAFTNLNFNHIVEGSNPIGDDASGRPSLNSFRHLITYDSPITVTSSRYLLISEKGGNNQQYLVARDAGGNEIGELQVNTSDYISGGVSNNTGETIKIGTFPLSDLAPLGTAIKSIEILAADADPGDGKVIIADDMTFSGCDVGYTFQHVGSSTLGRTGDANLIVDIMTLNAPVSSVDFKDVLTHDTSTMVQDHEQYLFEAYNPLNNNTIGQTGYTTDTINSTYDNNMNTDLGSIINTTNGDMRIRIRHYAADNNTTEYNSIELVSFCYKVSITADPIAVDDVVTTPEETAIVIDVLTNDTDPDGDTLSVVPNSASTPTNGMAIINGDGTLTYTPNANFSGTDIFEYNVTDGNGGTDTGIVSVTVTIDTDGDNITNDIDLDDDNDGILDINEGCVESPFAETQIQVTSGVSVNSQATDAPLVVPSGINRVLLVAFGLEANGNPNYTITYGGIVMHPLNIEVTHDLNSLNIYYLTEVEIAAIPTAETTGELVVGTIDGGQLGEISIYVTALTNIDQTQLTVSNQNVVGVSGDQTNYVYTFPTVNAVEGDYLFSFVASGGGTAGNNNFSNWTVGTETADLGWNGSNLGGSLFVPAIDGNYSEATTVTFGRRFISQSFILKPASNNQICNQDTDDDGIPDYLDLDSDNDGIPDNVEAQATQDYMKPTGVDSDNDGLDDVYDTNLSGDANSAGLTPINTDSTDNADYLDLDSDNDTIFDIVESGQGLTADANGSTTGSVGVNGLDDAVESADDYTDVNGLAYDGTNFTLDDTDNDTAADGSDASPTTTDLDYRDTAVANSVPVAVDDNMTVLEDGSASLDVLNNDSFGGDGEGNFSILTPPTHGTILGIALSAPNMTAVVTYTPNTNYNGADSFTYKITDANGDESIATVTITVTPENDAPVAVDDNKTTPEDTDLVLGNADIVTPNDTDPEGDTLTITAVSNPTNGTVTVTAGVVTFVPTPNFNGTATFDYTISDGSLTDTATVTIVVVANTILPDYEVSLSISKGIFIDIPGNFDLVIRFTEGLSGINTGDVVLSINKNNKITLDFDSSLPTLGGITLDNANWEWTETLATYRLTYIGNGGIFPEFTRAYIGISSIFTPPDYAKGKFPLNVKLREGSGDTNSTNNEDTEVILYSKDL